MCLKESEIWETATLFYLECETDLIYKAEE